MHPKVRSYRDLVVWQRAMDLIDQVTRLCRALELSDRLVYETQIRRAALSIATAIAEGHERLHTREFQQYTYVGRASLAEVETQLISIGRNTERTQERVTSCLALAGEVGRMLTRLGEALRRKKPRRDRPGPESP